MGLYAEDGKCHNAETGLYGHECGKPALWIGTDASGFRSGFCQTCKESGAEGVTCIAWEKWQALAQS